MCSQHAAVWLYVPQSTWQLVRFKGAVTTATHWKLYCFLFRIQALWPLGMAWALLWSRLPLELIVNKPVARTEKLVWTGWPSLGPFSLDLCTSDRPKAPAEHWPPDAPLRHILTEPHNTSALSMLQLGVDISDQFSLSLSGDILSVHVIFHLRCHFKNNYTLKNT